MSESEEDTKINDISPEQRLQIIDWLNSKNSKLKCECCGGDQWHIASNFMTFINVDAFHDHAVFGGNMYPSFMIICKTCGNSKFFNSIVADIKRD